MCSINTFLNMLIVISPPDKTIFLKQRKFEVMKVRSFIKSIVKFSPKEFLPGVFKAFLKDFLLLQKNFLLTKLFFSIMLVKRTCYKIL